MTAGFEMGFFEFFGSVLKKVANSNARLGLLSQK